MKKYIFIAIAVVLGLVVLWRFNGPEDTWVCQAGEWVKHGNPSQQKPLSDCEGKQEALLLDVRTVEEWNAGHIKGAILLPLDKIQQGEVPNVSKNANIQIYCRSGNRAGVALELLSKAGYTNVKNIGGLEDLKAQGYLVE